MEKLWFPPLQEEDPLITEKIKYSIFNIVSLKTILEIADERTLKQYMKIIEEAGIIIALHKCGCGVFCINESTLDTHHFMPYDLIYVSIINRGVWWLNVVVNEKGRGGP